MQFEQEEYIICLTGDHTTPIRLGDHTFEPVPFTTTTYSAVANRLGLENVPQNKTKLLEFRDKVERFDEAAVCEGLLGRFPGSQAIQILKNFKEAIKNYV